MRVLAWDTSSKEGVLTALEWDEKSKSGWEGVRLVAEWMLNLELTHSERLLWGVDQILESARWKLEDIDVFGVGLGPGSFTGLRVGVTTARTLAHTVKRPIVGVSSLAVLARPSANALAGGRGKEKTIVIAATDAAKGELFAIWGAADSLLDCVVLSDGDAPGCWKRGVEERVIAPDDLLKSVKKKLSESEGAKWVVVGEAARRYPDLWAKLPKSQRREAPQHFPHLLQGRALAHVVWQGVQAGLARNALQIHPRYLRASEAEVKMKAGLLKPAPVSES